MLEYEGAARLATVRLAHPQRAGVLVNLLFASCGIEPEIVRQAEDLEVLPDLVLPVARTGHLIAMRLLAKDDRNRPTDADDLRAMAAVAGAEDWDLARVAIGLITECEYNRDRDLGSALTKLTQWTVLKAEW